MQQSTAPTTSIAAPWRQEYERLLAAVDHHPEVVEFLVTLTRMWDDQCVGIIRRVLDLALDRDALARQMLSWETGEDMSDLNEHLRANYLEEADHVRGNLLQRAEGMLARFAGRKERE